MRFALVTESGIEFDVGSTPLPEGAIHPIPNWDDIINVPGKYLKLVGDVIVEMTEEEKIAYDEAHPPTIQELQEQATQYLDSTEYFVIDSVDPSSEEPIPQEITDARALARELLEED